eukprot:1718170-Alexandrium_andersonii.AAC.1
MRNGASTPLTAASSGSVQFPALPFQRGYRPLEPIGRPSRPATAGVAVWMLIYFMGDLDD